MNQIEALQRIRALNAPMIETRDAAALLAVSPANANIILKRLAGHGMLVHLARGRWLTRQDVARLALPEFLSAPYPAYVSMQSALFHHGLIEQIPAVTYAATLARTRRIVTPAGVVSLHHIPAELFLDFTMTERGMKIACAEKALFDTLYLAPSRGRIFSQLPEVSVPRGFRWARLRDYARLVKFDRRRTHIERRIEEVRGQSGR